MASVLARSEPPWLLIMDEPTNHLDLASIEELEHALQAFDERLYLNLDVVRSMFFRESQTHAHDPGGLKINPLGKCHCAPTNYRLMWRVC